MSGQAISFKNLLVWLSTIPVKGFTLRVAFLRAVFVRMTIVRAKMTDLGLRLRRQFQDLVTPITNHTQKV
jgi:hypothetical protein